MNDQLYKTNNDRDTLTRENASLYWELTGKKMEITKLPIIGVDIFFNDDIWDFSNLNKLESNLPHVFKFKNIPLSYKNLFKWTIFKNLSMHKIK